MDNPWMVALLSLVLGGYPLMPALVSGQLPGVGHTDLIPAVWSMWAFAQEFPSLGQTQLLGFPNGMGWFPQSLFSALFGFPLQLVFSIPVSYAIGLWIARSLTFGLFYKAGRAWDLSVSGACLSSLAIGLSPILFGYAYEGIVEGVHIWPLGLWLWMLARKSPIGIALGFFLSIVASWYLAAVACLLFVFVHRQDKAHFSLLGLMAALPLIWIFFDSFPEQQMIDDHVRRAHAISMAWPEPFWLRKTPAVFGQSAYVSVILLGLLVITRRWRSLWLLVPISLAGALPILSDLPVLSAVRFPYRWQVATTVLAVIMLRNRLRRPVQPWLILLVVLELIFVSPFPPLLPTTPFETEAINSSIKGPVLNLPNLIQRPPGEFNPSKKRAKSIYFAQFQHRQPIMALPGFNGLNQSKPPIPDGLLALDPLSALNAEITEHDIQALRQIGLRYILVHRNQWPSKSSRLLQDQMAQIGYIPIESTETNLLFDLENGP